LGIDDDYIAYCLDQVVGEFGSYVRHELEKVQGKTDKEVEGRRELMLRRLLTAESEADLYAAPVATTD
jgi:hypothetical protein